MKKFTDGQKVIIKELEKTLSSIKNVQVDNLIEAIENSKKVFFIGVGRVLLSLQSIAKRLAHLGVKAYIVGQITEPAITEKDLLIVGSGSGESLFPVSIAKKAKQIGAKVAHIGSNPNSSMRELTDFFVRIPVQTKLGLEDEIVSEQPMTSLFEQSLLLLGDTIALLMIERKSINMRELWAFHANLE